MSLVIRTQNHPYAKFVNTLLEDNKRRMGQVNEFEQKASQAFGLALDVNENDDAYTVTTNLPGVKLDDISVNIHDNVLTVNADINATEYDENTRVLMQERRTGKFSRNLRFPMAVDGNAIEASFDNGVLNIVIPKAEEAKPRQIPVTVAHSNN